MSNTLRRYGLLAQLAQAAYVPFKLVTPNADPQVVPLGADVRVALEREWTPEGSREPGATSYDNEFAQEQARALIFNSEDGIGRFELADRTASHPVLSELDAGFAATLFRERGTNKAVLAIRGTEGGLFGVDRQDANFQILRHGIADRQIVAMYNYVERLRAPLGADVAQYAIDRIEAPGTGRVISYALRRAPDGVGLGKIGANETIDVTGHSLGGHLAIALSRLYPTLTDKVYAYNSAGFKNDPFSKPIIDRFFSLFSGAETTFADHKISNIFTEPGPEFVNSRILFGQPGEPLPFFAETNGFDLARSSSHSVRRLADSLMVQSVLQELDPSLTGADTDRIVRAASASIVTSLEDALDAVRFAVLGLADRSGGDGGDTNRQTLYTNLYRLIESAQFAELKQRPGTRIVDLSRVAHGQIVLDAAAQFGTFLALKQLAPIAIVGGIETLAGTNHSTLFGEWQQEIAAGLSGRHGYSTEWFNDRAAMLTQLLRRNVVDAQSAFTPPFGQPATRYRDETTKTEVQVGGIGLRYVSFGADSVSDELRGAERADRLYGGGGADRLEGLGEADYLQGDAGSDALLGGAGNDTLFGGLGQDRLRGGTGNDIYRWNTGDGWDTIVDRGESTGARSGAADDGDGRGVLLWNGAAIGQGVSSVGGSKTLFTDGVRQYAFAGLPGARGTLRISLPGGAEGLVIEQFKNGELGITLPGVEERVVFRKAA